jgi:hypothetical protein
MLTRGRAIMVKNLGSGIQRLKIYPLFDRSVKWVLMVISRWSEDLQFEGKIWLYAGAQRRQAWT